jgi:hypothetical protein
MNVSERISDGSRRNAGVELLERGLEWMCGFER